jgi:mannose-6-phosphate isomerase
MLYPLKFHTIFKDKIWGGEKIRTILKKDFSPILNCGESWEVSGVQNNETIIRNGHLAGKNLNQITHMYQGQLLGKRVFQKFRSNFPLLIKFIDAKQDLSIQVHPNDELSLKRHKSFGKTEMWYIIQAEENAELIAGFKQKIDKNTFIKRCKDGTLLSVLNKEKVFNDDVFFIPSGRIHTIGKGLLLAEIQQSSDVTYRIYDFDRLVQSGIKRELHIEEAIDAIDYNYYSEYKTRYKDREDTPFEIVHSKYFTTNKMILKKDLERNIKSLDSFVIYICLDGNGNIKHNNDFTGIKFGDVIFIPAELHHYTLIPDKNLKLLETFITE